MTIREMEQRFGFVYADGMTLVFLGDVVTDNHKMQPAHIVRAISVPDFDDNGEIPTLDSYSAYELVWYIYDDGQEINEFEPDEVIHCGEYDTDTGRIV